MKQLDEQKIIEYMDGLLSPEEAAAVENYLGLHAEDAELVRGMQFAASITGEMRSADEFRVSENFWPQLRDKLGPAPTRSAWNQFRNGVSGLFGTSRVSRLSVGAALAAIVIGMGAMLFAPKSAVQPASAGALTSEDLAFVQSSVDRHAAYVAAEPVVPGDASLRDGTGDEEDDEHTH